MGPVLHGRAKATHAIRVLKQRLKTSNAAPAGELGINVKTIAKRPKRDGVEDAHMHPKELRRAILSVEDKATTVAAYAIGAVKSTTLGLAPSEAGTFWMDLPRGASTAPGW